MAEVQQSETPQPKLEWVKPEVTRMGAGSAEMNAGFNTFDGQSFVS